jgi:hypothetical protein
MLKVDKISVEEKTIRKSKELDAIIASIVKHKLSDDPNSLLPGAPYHVVNFNLLNTYAGFANDIRRTLVEGIDVIAADIDDSRIKTDDEFVFGTSDVVVKNINLLPVNQDLDLDEMKKYTVYLLVANKTTEIIDINASDFTVGYVDDVRKKNSVKLQKDLGDPSLHKKTKQPSSNLSSHPSKSAGKSANKPKKSFKKGGDDIPEEDETVDETAKETAKETVDETKETPTVEDANDSDGESEPASKPEEKKPNKEISKPGKKPARHSMTSDSDANTGTTKITEAMLTRAYSDSEKSVIDIKKIFPNPNICIARLRPGKSLYIESIDFVVGKGSETMAKFSLLNNVRYQPINVDPYDFFTGTGKRSAEYDPKDFSLGFTTAGNITPKAVIKKTVQVLTDALVDIKKHIEVYASTEHKKYYSSDDLIVTLKDEVATYKFTKHYYTPINMIAQRCFLLDPNVLFCASAVERYDTAAGIIRLKHAEPNKLLLKSIEGCMHDLKTFASAFP